MRRLPRRKSLLAGRVAQRLERAAGELNPLLLAVAIGLRVLDLTCFITLRFIAPPRPQSADPPAAEVWLRGSAG